MSDDAEELVSQMNHISDLVVGHCGGSFGEIIQGIADLKVKAFKHEQNKNVEKLFSLIDDLSDTKQDVYDGIRGSEPKD